MSKVYWIKGRSNSVHRNIISKIDALLSLNGFDAITLKFGMCSWTDDPLINVYGCYSPPTTDLPTVSGSDPGTW